MPRTTQNFLDITDTRLDGQLTVELRVRTHGHTVSVIKLNDWLIKENHTTLQFDLFAPLLLTIDLVEFTEGSSGVEVELFTINNFEILILPDPFLLQIQLANHFHVTFYAFRFALARACYLTGYHL